MLGVGVKVHADTSELEVAESKLVKFGEHFEHHFLHHLSKMVGIVALAGGAAKLIEGIIGKPEEIEKASRSTGLLTDEVQMLTKYAEENGQTFEQMLEKVKSGAIDLASVFMEMRSRGELDLINKEDVETITEDMNLLKERWNSIQNAMIRGTAHVVRAVSDPASINAMAASMHAMPGFNGVSADSRAVGGVSPKPFDLPEEGAPFGAGFFGSAIGMAMTMSPAVLKNMRMRELQAQLLGLKNDRSVLRMTQQNEIIAPQLSGWQQMGGFSGEKGTVVAKLDEVTQATKENGDKIEKVEMAIESLKGG